jgi:hypothetical protein
MLSLHCWQSVTACQRPPIRARCASGMTTDEFNAKHSGRRDQQRDAAHQEAVPRKPAQMAGALLQHVAGSIQKPVWSRGCTLNPK